ncbi:glycosyltransferase family 2 protein [Paenibacillus chartarius]|uniref:Glycosyltransferase family 2 protein n=1 Tax=Paenibacillus chartarius TaxID=747481 RepID=A0ABV6DKU2_9BACL
MRVDILLSIYNGEKYLPELLNSLEAQTFTNWRLVVRDDGSNDASCLVIKNFKSKYPEKVLFIEEQSGCNMKPAKSFFFLLKYVEAEYVMFCDQDDVWLPQKIESTIEEMKVSDPDLPTLVHTDLTVVDEKLNIINESFWQYQNIHPQKKSLNQLLIQNNITGCTALINRKLLELVRTYNENMIMHDWWIGLMAAAFGEIKFINKSTILYRQHGKNDTGAKKYSLFYFFKQMRNINKSIASNKKIVNQGKAFISDYEDCLTNEQKELLNCVSSLFEMNRMNRLKGMIKQKLSKHGLIRTLGFYCIMMLSPKIRPLR